MDMIEIIVQIEPDVEGILIVPNQRFQYQAMAICIDQKSNMFLVDMDKAMEVIASYGINSASEMMGKTDFILIYNEEKVLKVAGHKYVCEDAIIMKSFSGLKLLNDKEQIAALSELKSRIVRFQVGAYSMTGYEVS